MAHFGLMNMIGINLMFAGHATATEVLQADRSVFLRERAGGYYQTLPYLLSKTLFEFPSMLLQSLVVLLGTYWSVGLRGNFAVLVLECTALSMTSSSLMYCLSALASNRAEAMGLVTMPQLLQFGFSGLLLPIKEIPTFLQWIKWLCPLYYGM